MQKQRSRKHTLHYFNYLENKRLKTINYESNRIETWKFGVL